MSKIGEFMSLLFITATDTDAGKTVLTTALAAYWQLYYPSRTLGLMKLLQTGTGDRELYHQLFSLEQSLEELNPVHFHTPLAPPIAADYAGCSIDLNKVWKTLQELQQKREFILIESLGGLGSPVTHELTVADLAYAWRLPTVLVVPVKLGAIAHTVANIALARQTGVKLKGIVLNCTQPRSPQEIADFTPISLIESLTQLPVLGCLPYVDDPTNLSKLAQIVSELDLECLIPLQFSSGG